MGERLIIRSYRRVFQLDRRLYRVDRWALPVPGGVPLRALGYFTATLLAVVVLGGLPGVGELVGFLSPPLRYVVLPLAVAVLGTQAAPDGRAAHRFAWDWLRLRIRARRRCSGRVVALEGEPVLWHGEVAVRWDGEGAQLRPGRVCGPARVTFTVPVGLDGRGSRLQARPAANQPAGQSVVLCGGTVLEVRP
jgi:hypothetical protein